MLIDKVSIGTKRLLFEGKRIVLCNLVLADFLLLRSTNSIDYLSEIVCSKNDY